MTTRTESDLASPFQGCILGLAIGDALGRPTEFLDTAEAIRQKFGPDGVTDFEADRHPRGTYTDDTQMSLAVARALVRAGHRPLDALMSIMADEFVRWHRSPENDRAPGHTCRAGCENLEQGAPWRTAGLPHSKGCGSAMRTAPIGLFYHDDDVRLMEVARASSLLTHRHPTALAAAVAAALAVAWALRGEGPQSLLPYVTNRVRRTEGCGEVLALLERIPDTLHRPPDDVLCRGVLGDAWCGDEAVACAMYCFLRSPRDYRRTVLTGANAVGDSDSIACIAGSISGAYNGLEAIPEPWRREVEDSACLHEIGQDLLAARKRLPRSELRRQ